ncbi:MAG: glycosyltransferase family 1 protein [bacterium]|nr:glycosyltransferase family 1 protein [bacterium]
MKIGIDATSLCRRITGIEYYTLNLIKNILEMDKENEYVILFRKEIHPELMKFRGIGKFLICPINNQIFCEQIWLPYISWKEGLDLIHFPAFPPGLFFFKKHIVTIHDATIWKYPHTLSWKGRFYMRPLTILASKRAEMIITPSENSKREIIEYAKVREEKVVNTKEGIDERFMPIKQKDRLEEIRKKYGLPIRFILSVCSLEPRKNLLTLIEAYKILRDKDPNLRLVLVGRKAWGNDAILRRIEELGLKDELFLTGYIPIEDLVYIYNLAELFVYPSIYEGFGLPPLEAMACDCPVITSNTSSLPEVVGDAAILVDPLDVDNLSESIYRVLNDEYLKKAIRCRGIERVKEFSWEKSVRETLRVYKKVSLG